MTKRNMYESVTNKNFEQSASNKNPAVQFDQQQQKSCIIYSQVKPVQICDQQEFVWSMTNKKYSV